MKHLTYAEKSLLIGDRAADLAMEYGAVLATRGVADTITLRGFGADGDEVVATLLLDSGANVMVETTHTSIEEPDNAEAESYMKDRIKALSSPRTALPTDQPPAGEYADDDEIPPAD